MIFITVGTHEQGMERLLIEIDNLIEKEVIREEVFAQIGYSKYIPKNYKYEKMIGYDKMDLYVRNARIIITHGGPGSIFHPLQYGKVPIVVPRDPKYNEHVDNHQILFTNRLENNKKVIAVYNIDNLNEAITKYDVLKKQCIYDKSSLDNFIPMFDNLISKLNLI